MAESPSLVLVKSIKNTKVGNMKKSKRNTLFKDIVKRTPNESVKGMEEAVACRDRKGEKYSRGLIFIKPSYLPL